MKTNKHAQKVLKVRYSVGLLAVLLLVSAEFWMVFNLERGCGQGAAQPPIQVPAIGDLFSGLR